MRGPVAMITHSYYDEDPRVRREAEALVAAGHEVDAFALRRPDDHPHAVLRGVNIRRLDVQRHQGASLAVYLGEYLGFFARAAVAAARAHRRRHFAVVQVHTLPDFLVFATLPLKVAGVPVVLDLHEAMPEFFRGRFALAAKPPVMRLIELQELLSIDFADAVITVNRALGERLTRRGVPAAKITVVHNSPSADLFDPRAHPRRVFMEDGSLGLVYTGALTPIYELDVVLDAVARIVAERPALPLHLDLYGRGDSEPVLRSRSSALGLDRVVAFHGRIPIESVAAAIAQADIGLAPTRRDPLTELSLSTKILEYAVMGKPVVASRLATVARYFGPDTLMTYRSGDPADLASAILSLVDDPAERERRVERSALRVAGLAWEHEAAAYVGLIDRLVARAPSPGAGHEPAPEPER